MTKILLACACLAAAALFTGPAAASGSKPIYKCVDAKGAMTFQAAPCTAGAQQSEVKLREPPKEPEAADDEEREFDPETGQPIEVAVAVSYECTTAQGWTFYKHKPCPPGIRVAKPGAAVDKSDQLAQTQGEWVRVTSAPVTRMEACRRIAEGTARKGHVFDDVVTDRDRGTGNDPCRPPK